MTTILTLKEGEQVAYDGVVYTIPVSGVYRFSIHNGVEIVREDGWVMLDDDEDTVEIEVDEIFKERLRTPSCICGLVPRDDCPIDHMGRKQKNTCTCPPGGLHTNCPVHG